MVVIKLLATLVTVNRRQTELNSSLCTIRIDSVSITLHIIGGYDLGCYGCVVRHYLLKLSFILLLNRLQF